MDEGVGARREHGGPDALGVPCWDFSTNTHPCGPCPLACPEIAQAARQHYPDPAYTALRQALAQWHGVSAERILIAASGSEWIMRFAAWACRRGWRRAWWSTPGYGDYAHAARVWGLQRCDNASVVEVGWLCDPGSPTGEPLDAAQAHALLSAAAQLTLDLAYEPLRLEGSGVPDDIRRRCWQLITPNKALGLTGVRAAYVIAPEHASLQDIAALNALAPSWPIGADGVAMLRAWVRPAVQQWLCSSLPTLRQWKVELMMCLQALGWVVAPGQASFLCASPPAPISAQALRAAGVKLRDATSLGMPGWWRLSVQPPSAVAALARQLRRQAPRPVQEER